MCEVRAGLSSQRRVAMRQATHTHMTMTTSVHGWVYDLGNGELIDLNFDFEGSLKKIQEVYDITK